MDNSRAVTFIAVYRGRTASDARLVALSADPSLVAVVVGQILTERDAGAAHDPVVAGIERARRQSLRLIRRELRPTTAGGHHREPRQ